MLDRLTGSFPPPTLPLVGRQTELIELDTLLAHPACRLITLVGPGGMGKTRLALEVATRHQETFPDGVAFVDLQSVPRPDLLAATIANALHLPLQGTDDLAAQLLLAVRRQQQLLVLDSFEHLREGTRLLVALLQHAPQLKLLVTSREVLNLRAEWVYPLDTLPVPPVTPSGNLMEYPSIALFVAHAQRVRPDFSLEREQTAVVQICRLVNGLPLALELAAAWTRTLACATLAAELAHNLALLTTTCPDVPERHRSVQATCEQAWERLHPAEQTVFMQLAVFRGSFSWEAAVHVAGATLPLLTALVDKSLVRRMATRYQLHDWLRQYAEQRLNALPDAARSIRQAHADYYIAWLRAREEAILSAAQRELLDAIASEIENIRFAWEWVVAAADVNAIAQGEHTLAKYYQFHGFYQEGSNLLAQALTCLQGIPAAQATDIIRANLLVDRALLDIRLGRMDAARAALAASQGIYLQYNVPPRPGCSTDPRIGLSELALYAGDYAEAARLGVAAAERNAAHNHAINLLEALHMLVHAHRCLGDYPRAQTYAEQLLQVAQSIQHRYVLAFCFNALGTLAYALDNYDDARHYLQSAYAFAEEVPNLQIQALSLLLLGKVSLLQAQYAEAEAVLQQSLALFQDMGDQSHTAQALTTLGQVAHARACLDEAGHWFAQALDLATGSGYLPLTLYLMSSIGAWLLQTNHAEQAAELLAFVLHHPSSDPETIRQAQPALNRCQATLNPPLFATAIERGQTLDRATATTRTRLALLLPNNANRPPPSRPACTSRRNICGWTQRIPPQPDRGRRSNRADRAADTPRTRSAWSDCGGAVKQSDC